MTSQFSNMTSMSNFFDVVLFLLSSLVTGPSFMSRSSLVMELWQFCFIRDWPETWKSEIPPSEFCPISGDWGKLWIPNLAWMSLIECYRMLQNSRVTIFTIFELLREIQLGGGCKITELIFILIPDTTIYSCHHLVHLGKLGWGWVLPLNYFMIRRCYKHKTLKENKPRQLLSRSLYIKIWFVLLIIGSVKYYILR